MKKRERCSETHHHPRDDVITFDEGPHIYTVNGDSTYVSVTTLNKAYFEEFQEDVVIEKMARGLPWVNDTFPIQGHKYYGMTRDEIKNQWEVTRVEASQAGTEMHKNIEEYYNGEPIESDSTEWSHFHKFLKDHSHLSPYRTEWMIWDADIKVAGSIDMVFQDSRDGAFYIYDWKRSKAIDTDNRFRKFSHVPCISHIPDTNYGHYCLQLNTYKAILEKNYDMTIKGMYLVVLHPNSDSYQKYAVPDLSKEMASLFELRRKEVEVTE